MTDNKNLELKLFVVAAILSKHEINPGNVKSITKLLTGYRYGNSKDEVLGNYTNFILTDFSTWSIDDINILEVEKSVGS